MVPFLTLVVADVMATQPLCVEPSTPLSKVRDLFHIHEYGALPVVEDEQMLGWVTQFDLLSVFLPIAGQLIPDYDEILARPVHTIMREEPESMTTTDSLARVLHRMIDTRHRSFPVVDDNRLVGVIAREDILKGLDEEIPAR